MKEPQPLFLRERHKNMSDDFDSQLNITQSNNPSSSEKITTSSKIGGLPKTLATVSSAPQSPASHLKLVVSKDTKPSLKRPTSKAVSEPVYKSAPSLNHYFTAEVRRRSPDDFIMVAHDPFHYLRCELPLKFEEGEEGLSLVCQFPTIGDDELVDFIEEDEDLLGIVLITFNMHILQNLFSFCAAHKVKNLIIKATDEQFKGLGIYQEFIKHVDKMPTKQGMMMEITIPVHSNSRAECDEFMEDMTTQFRKTLWQEKITNSAIRDYLKANVRLSVVH